MSESDFAPFNVAKLHQAISDAWHEALLTVQSESRFSAPRFEESEISRAISVVFHASLASIARDRNSAVRTRASALPVEVLAQILSRLESFSDRAAAALVSSSWNTAFLHSPRLWSQITCKASIESAQQMLKQLQLSSHTSIDLAIKISEANAEITIPALRDNIRRCARLDISFDSGIEQSTVEAVALCLHFQSAPRLANFWLQDPNSYALNESTFLKVHFFNNFAPRLDRMLLNLDALVLRGAHVGAFANVRTASLLQAGAMNEHHLGEVFKALPRIECLTVRVSDWQDLTNGLTAEDQDQIVPPASLRSIDIISYREDGPLIHLLKRLRWQDIFRVSLQPKGGLYEHEDLHYFFDGILPSGQRPQGRKPLQTAWIDWEDEPETLEVGLTLYLTEVDADLHVLLPPTYKGDVPSISVFERSAFELNRALPATLFTHVTKLYLHELAFDQEALPNFLPVFPMVVELRVMLMNMHYIRNDVGVSPFIGMLTEDTWVLEVPSLEALYITAGHDPNYRPRIAPGMVLPFIRECLRYDASRLKGLAFVGLDFYFEPGARVLQEFDELVRLAEETTWDERSMPWAINLDSYRAHLRV